MRDRRVDAFRQRARCRGVPGSALGGGVSWLPVTSSFFSLQGFGRNASSRRRLGEIASASGGEIRRSRRIAGRVVRQLSGHNDASFVHRDVQFSLATLAATRPFRSCPLAFPEGGASTRPAPFSSRVTMTLLTRMDAPTQAAGDRFDLIRRYQRFALPGTGSEVWGVVADVVSKVIIN
jgi:hypothetical protein